MASTAVDLHQRDVSPPRGLVILFAAVASWGSVGAVAFGVAQVFSFVATNV